MKAAVAESTGRSRTSQRNTAGQRRATDEPKSPLMVCGGESYEGSHKQHLTTYQLVGMQLNKDVLNQGALVMDTILVATQIVCYGVGVVSASLNIASFVHRRVKRRRLHTIRRGLVRSTMITARSADLS